MKCNLASQKYLKAGGLAGCWLRPREAQRGPERRSVDRTSLSCAWLEAPHKQIYDQGGSPQISCICVEPLRMPHRLPLHMFIGFQTEIQVKPRASPQAELQPGRFPTSRITTREPTYCPQAELRPGSWLAGWLGWLGGSLAG